MGKPIVIRLGTRGSPLARAQSRVIADDLERAEPLLRVELVIVKTTGDSVQDRPLAELGGKGLFTKEIEQHLLAGALDFAVHSYKDVPVTMPLVDTPDLIIAGVPPREDARDVLIGRPGITGIDDLPQGARVGTCSLRRRCQLLNRRPDLVIEDLRGNIDSRLARAAAGAFDAILLAAAGLKRAGWFDATHMVALPFEAMLPAAGQGALALQCRRDDPLTADLLRLLHHEPTARCVEVEREVISLLQADCRSPVAAYATLTGDQLTLRAAAGLTGGIPPVRQTSGETRLDNWRGLAARVAQDIA